MPYGCSHTKPFPSFRNLAQGKIFIMQMCILIYNTPFSSPLAKIYKTKMQRRQHIPDPVFLWTPSDTRGDNRATEKNIIKERSVPLFKPITTLRFAISLGVTERAAFCFHPDYFNPSALHLPTRQTWPYIIITQAAMNSSARVSEQVKSQQHGGNHLPYLGGYCWFWSSLKSNLTQLRARLKFSALMCCWMISESTAGNFFLILYCALHNGIFVNNQDSEF